MRSSSTDSPEYSGGYRRYVYRINFRLPFEIKFPAKISYKDPINYDLPENNDDDDDKKKKDKNEEQKTT